jgi:hypothetical protein
VKLGILDFCFDGFAPDSDSHFQLWLGVHQKINMMASPIPNGLDGIFAVPKHLSRLPGPAGKNRAAVGARFQTGPMSHESESASSCGRV